MFPCTRRDPTQCHLRFSIPKWPPRPGPPSCTEFAVRGRPNLRSFSSQQFSKGGDLYRAPAGRAALARTVNGVPPIKPRGWYQGGAGAGLLFWEVCWSPQRQAGDFRDFAAVPRVGAGGGWGDILLSLNGSARPGSCSKCEDLRGFPELCSVGKSSARAPRASFP